jgi:hypothetical protein
MCSRQYSSAGNTSVSASVSLCPLNPHLLTPDPQLTPFPKKKDHKTHRVLHISFYIKLVFVLVEIVLAIAFASCNFTKAQNAAAVLEWLIAFIFSFYVFSFYVDLYPAVRTRHAGGAGFKSRDPAVRRAADREMEEAGSDRYLTGHRDGGHPPAENGYTNGAGHGARGVHSYF